MACPSQCAPPLHPPLGPSQVLVGLTQLRVLEFGICYDGSEETHGVPAALAQLSRLCSVHELALPMWRKTFGGQAHPLAPALSRALAGLPALASLEVDGRFGSLAVVSTLSGLTRLCAAAPLAEAGWKVRGRRGGVAGGVVALAGYALACSSGLGLGGDRNLADACAALPCHCEAYVPAKPTACPQPPPSPPPVHKHRPLRSCRASRW